MTVTAQRWLLRGDVLPLRPAGPRPAPARHIVLRAPALTGTALAVVFFALAQTPSLLPRSWATQGAVGGLSAAAGYGIGVLLALVARPLLRRPAVTRLGSRGRRIAWWVVGVLAAALIVVSLVAGRAWQREIRALVGMPPQETWHESGILVVAALVAVVVVLTGRSLRLAVRGLQQLLRRVAPEWLAAALGGLLGALLVGGLIQGLVLGTFFDTAERSAALANDATAPGVVQPVSANRSGSPESLVPWTSLGSRGRELVAGGPTPQQISELTGRPAADPIRVYVGVETEPDLDDRVALALAELDRTGAWNRDVLVVATTTGTGWVNPESLAAVEYLTDGDSAVVTIQYGYLPSWISVLSDGSRATEAGKALTGAVRQRWAELPAGQRPRLMVYGESLGSRGAESAFRDVGDLIGSTDAALLVGPTSANPLWRAEVAAREPGSPVWLPVQSGGRVVFADKPDDLPAPGEGRRPDLVYLQNSSDPVTWWSPSLLWQQPGWLQGPRGPDVSPAMRWYPVVTFWQVAVDLVSAGGDIPSGHGHRYGPEIAQAMATLLAPDGWDAADTARLRTLVMDPEITGDVDLQG